MCPGSFSKQNIVCCLTLISFGKTLNPSKALTVFKLGNPEKKVIRESFLEMFSKQHNRHSSAPNIFSRSGISSLNRETCESMRVNEGILSRDFPQPSLGYFTLGDDEKAQLITFIILLFLLV